MAPRKGQGFKRRVIDKKASLRAYEARMHTLSDETMQRLANKWIASFEMYDTFPTDYYTTVIPKVCIKPARK